MRYTVPSRFGALLSVGAVVQAHTQPAGFDMSLYLLLPVVNQGGRADDQSSFGNYKAGV